MACTSQKKGYSGTSQSRGRGVAESQRIAQARSGWAVGGLRETEPAERCLES